MNGVQPAPAPAVPLLLFNGECAVCRAIAAWVKASLGPHPLLSERAIGDDPVALRALNPALGIWDAYATIHLLMPDGTMKQGGEAVAEVLRRLPNCRWFAGLFALRVAGVRPFQRVLDLGYLLLSEVRPLLGCESCGTQNRWVQSVQRAVAWLRVPFSHRRHASPRPVPKPARR